MYVDVCMSVRGRVCGRVEGVAECRMQPRGGGSYLRPFRETLQAAKRRWGWMEYMAGLATILLAVAAVSLTWHPDKRLESRGMADPGQEEPGPERRVIMVEKTVVKEPGDGVCLDGSPPAYHLQQGSGSGSKSWIVMLEGGGWCRDVKDCVYRAGTRLGSSAYMEAMPFEGILSSSPAANPDFHAWTRVKVRYCDGGSFAGHRTDKEEAGIFFRGREIWRAVMADLLRLGLKDAEHALLVGCSAGALAAMLHCDDFAELLPEAERVRCLSDAGFFMRVPDVAGRATIADLYAGVVEMQGAGVSLPAACTASRPALDCFFPEVLVHYIRTPLFVLNSPYDDWQVRNVLVPGGSDPAREWSRCRDDLARCSEEQLQVVHGFRNAMLKELQPLKDKNGSGMFVNSCFTHCQTEWPISWNGAHAVRLDGRTIADTVGDWYFDRKPAHLVDCAYPCNPSCPIR